MLDRLVVLLALVALAAFLAPLVYEVPEPVLILVLGGGFLLAAVDAVLSTFRNGGEAGREDPPRR